MIEITPKRVGNFLFRFTLLSIVVIGITYACSNLHEPPLEESTYEQTKLKLVETARSVLEQITSQSGDRTIDTTYSQVDGVSYNIRAISSKGVSYAIARSVTGKHRISVLARKSPDEVIETITFDTSKK